MEKKVNFPMSSSSTGTFLCHKNEMEGEAVDSRTKLLNSSGFTKEKDYLCQTVKFKPQFKLDYLLNQPRLNTIMCS